MVFEKVDRRVGAGVASRPASGFTTSRRRGRPHEGENQENQRRIAWGFTRKCPAGHFNAVGLLTRRVEYLRLLGFEFRLSNCPVIQELFELSNLIDPRATRNY
jgi:hypothetical protein